MKKLLIAIVIVLSSVSMRAQITEGLFGANLAWRVDTVGKYLQIFPDTVWNFTPRIADMYEYYCSFDGPGQAPWAAYGDIIREAIVYAPATLGDYTFSDLKELRYYRMLADVNARYAGLCFWGATNLVTVEVQYQNPADDAVGPLALMTSDTTQVEVILVNNDIPYWDDVTQSWVSPGINTRPYESADYAWKLSYDPTTPSPEYQPRERLIVPAQGTYENELGDCATWRFGQSDTLGTLKLTISACPQSATPADNQYMRIPDMDISEAPWGIAGKFVEDLYIDAPVRYIGTEAFSELRGLKSVSLVNPSAPLDSMHYRAFFSGIRLWKWVFGDIETKTAIPPVIIGRGEFDTVPYNHGSILYIPDTMVNIGGADVQCMSLFYSSPYWSEFSYITDRTIRDMAISSTEAKLYWFPISWISEYAIHFSWVENEELKDTTLIVYADGKDGYMDVKKMLQVYGGTINPTGAPYARRSPMDVGGSTLVINIGSMSLSMSTNSGSQSSPAFEITVSNLEPETAYGYGMSAKNQGGDVRKSSEGTVVTPQSIESAITDVERAYDGATRIYDIQGRYLGADTETLPAGVYIKTGIGGIEKFVIAR